MIWLTIDGNAYIHSKRAMLFVSNSFVLSLYSMPKAIEGAKVAKKRVLNQKNCVFLPLLCLNGIMNCFSRVWKLLK